MVEPWVQRALLLSGTFACAGVVLAYRAYAIENGWPVGRWAFADASWVKVLAAVTMAGTLLLAPLSRAPGGLFSSFPLAGSSLP